MNNQSVYEELGLKPSCKLSNINKEILLDKASVLKSLYRENVTEGFRIITTNNGYFHITCTPIDFCIGDIQYIWDEKDGFGISDGAFWQTVPLSLLENIKFSKVNFGSQYKISFSYGELEQLVVKPSIAEQICFSGYVFVCHPTINPQKRESLIIQDLTKLTGICQEIEKKNRFDEPIKFVIF
jgi:hypothetical protein